MLLPRICPIFSVVAPCDPGAALRDLCNASRFRGTIISGRGTIFLGESDPFEVAPGHLVFFKKGTVHGLTILEEPFVFLSVDTPRRDPRDITFVNPSDGTPDTFIKTKRLY